MVLAHAKVTIRFAANTREPGDVLTNPVEMAHNGSRVVQTTDASLSPLLAKLRATRPRATRAGGRSTSCPLPLASRLERPGQQFQPMESAQAG